MSIERFTVSRDDAIYEAFPDIVLTKSGQMICVFVENTHYSDRDKTRITLGRSQDRGRTWGLKTYLTQPGTNRNSLTVPESTDCPTIVWC